MKKITPLLMSLLFTMASFSQQGRTCETMEHLEDQKSQDPDIEDRIQEIERFTQRKLKRSRNIQQKAATPILKIPVVVHVLFTNKTNNISIEQINSQIAVLNKDFRRKNTDKTSKWSQATDSKIEFFITNVDPDGNPTSGITRKQVSAGDWGTKYMPRNSMKSTSSGGIDPWDTSKYLNMWIVPKMTSKRGGSTLGFAQFPGGKVSTDGIVMIHDAFGTIGTARAPFNLGRTTTHEIGHYLNLRHIWGDGPCGKDDFVSDTPESDAPNFGCKSDKSSCGSKDMVENFMDYSDDACMNLFTQGQKERMRAVLENGGARSSLVSSVSDTNHEVTYCSSKGKRATYEWIDNVTLGGMSNETGDNGGYKYFTTKTATLTQGSTNKMIISAGFKEEIYKEYWAVWIDFNQNGTFENSEKVVSGSSTSNKNLSATVKVPSEAKLGTTRMRVSMKYNESQDACENFDDGEVEDYKVSIISNTSDPNTTKEYNLNSEENIKITLIPNPAKDYIQVNYTTDAKNINYEIINCVGSIVKSGILTSASLDISDLENGVYILKVNDGKHLATKKLLKK